MMANTPTESKSKPKTACNRNLGWWRFDGISSLIGVDSKVTEIMFFQSRATNLGRFNVIFYKFVDVKQSITPHEEDIDSFAAAFRRDLWIRPTGTRRFVYKFKSSRF
jgi:hypothetical protein